MNKDIKDLISVLGFKPQEGEKEVYYKSYEKNNDYILKINFENESIDYGAEIKLGDLTTCNFENSENFVVLECVNRILEKGYPPDRLSLEHKWPMGRKEKGKLDILIFDKEDKAYLMIECKTWNEEYEKEKKKMQRDGGQLFSYYQQDKSAQYLCLYSSKHSVGRIEFVNDIIRVDEQWKELNNQKEIFDHWNKNFKDNGIFDEWANAYNIEIKAITKGRLKELTEDDSGRIFNQFAEILRHNVVSDKPNAFNKILNLFICKIIDEDRSDNEEVYFQWLENDTHENLQLRLNDLYKDGMKRFLNIDVTDYTDTQLEDKLFDIDEPEIKKQIKEMFRHLRLQKNPEFAFKEVYNEKSFYDNAQVVKEVVELLQPYRFRYSHKQQFLGAFFELLLNTSIKQEAGQFFTPVPIAKFIISCLPIKELIEKRIQINDNEILPYTIDFAAGSGHFLTEWMDELQKIINSMDTKGIRPIAGKKIMGWQLNEFEWAKEYVYGIEADYRLVKTTKVSSFLNGDGDAIIIRADGLDNFQKSNDYKGILKEVNQDDKRDNSKFDILIANPPYSVSAFKNTLKNGDESFELFDRLTDDSSEIECLFVERTKQLLKSGGWAGLILPSSILNNSGIYTYAREIILKYFNIIAIAEFGSNTFMATGTNTVTLFLERKHNYEWRKIETAVKNFFENPKEVTVNGIEGAFGKYVSNVFNGLELDDYISFVNKKPNENIQNQEFFADYKLWFDSLTEIKLVKEKKSFKAKSKTEQQNELDKVFYEKVFAREQDKILYFILVYPQKTVLINVGEKQSEKDFIGYEFSTRRGHEGIKMYRDKDKKPITKLYDEENHLNPEKANSYVYFSFLKQKISIENTLAENISLIRTFELMDFNKMNFEKTISLGIKKKVEYNSKWESKRLRDLCDFKNGLWTGKKRPLMKMKVLRNTDFTLNGYLKFENVAEIEVEANQYNERKLKALDILLEKSGGGPSQAIGRVAIYKGKGHYSFGNFISRIRPINKDVILPEYLWAYLNFLYQKGGTIPYQNGIRILNLDFEGYKNIKIPLPPKYIQLNIIKELSVIEQNEKIERKKIEKLKREMQNIYEKVKNTYPKIKITNIIDIISGGTPSTKEMIYWGGDIPWLSVVDFNNDNRFVYDTQKKITQEGFENSSTKFLSKGDLIISARGTVGAIAQLDKPMTFNQSCYGLRGKNGFENGLLYYILKYEINQLRENASGAIFDSITTKTFNSIHIPNPSIKEQRKILTMFEELENEIEAIKSSLSNTKNEKEQILLKYLS